MAALFRLYYFAAYLFFRAAEGLVRLLPLEAAFAVGAVCGRLAYYLLYRRRALARRNLELAFGAEFSEAQMREINREHFRLLAANLFAAIKAAHMSDEAVWARVAAHLPEERLRPGWIALISHIGNWELFSHLGGRFPEYRFGAIFQGLANPYIDRYLRRTRAFSGVQLFDRRTEILKCMRFLREGGVVGVLIDQAAGYAGLWTPFFGRLASSSTIAATLSIRSGHPVVPLAINTVGAARWSMTISEPVYPPEDGDTEAFTAQINRLLENQIRRQPADWLWAHQRWKPLRPHLLFARDQRRVYFPADFDRATLDPFRILIVSPETRVQARAALPAVEAIKRGRPDNWLAVLAPEATADLWEGLADALVECPPAETPTKLARRIRQRAPFDVAVLFEPRWRLALAVWLARIPVRVARAEGLLARLFTQHPPAVALPPHSAEAYLQIARSIGANVAPHVAPPAGPAVRP